MDKDDPVSTLKAFFERKAKGSRIDMVFLYGSWARGHPMEESDVDVALYFFPEPPSDEEIFRVLTDISYELSLKIDREVNAIAIFQDFRKPMLYYNAVVLSIPLYIKNFERYLVLKNQAIAQMEDFCLLGTGWQLELARRNMEVLHNA
jgi:predicted nucleotidyltransferase